MYNWLSIIHQETFRILVTQRNKQTMAYPYNAVLLNNNKKHTDDTHNSLDETQKQYDVWKKPDTE
jgi:hypothetical protein